MTEYTSLCHNKHRHGEIKGAGASMAVGPFQVAEMLEEYACVGYEDFGGKNYTRQLAGQTANEPARMTAGELVGLSVLIACPAWHEVPLFKPSGGTLAQNIRESASYSLTTNSRSL